MFGKKNNVWSPDDVEGFAQETRVEVIAEDAPAHRVASDDLRARESLCEKRRLQHLKEQIHSSMPILLVKMTQMQLTAMY